MLFFARSVGKEAQARYLKTPKGKATQRRYRRSLKGRITKNNYKARKRLEVNDG